MKTLITLLLVIGLSSSSFSMDILLREVSSVEIQEQRFVLKLADAIGPVRISIINPQGKIIDRTFFRVTTAQKIPFNLSLLPEGDYKVKLDTKEESLSFNINSYKKVEKKLMAYVKTIDENSFELLMVGVAEPGTKVTVYSSDHKVLNIDKIDEVGSFTKNYHLKYMALENVYLKVQNAKGKSKYLYFN
jgi:hypothetical protein